MPGPTLAQHFDQMLARLQQIDHAAEALARPLTPAQLAWSPEPGRWSIEQCLEHLAVTNARYREKIEPALARAAGPPVDGGARPYRPRFMARWIREMTGPELKRKMKAPKVFAPAARPAPGALSRFLAEQRRLAGLIEQARRLDATRVRFASPVSALFRVNFPEALELMVVHDQRHLRQAERVRQAAGFPD